MRPRHGPANAGSSGTSRSPDAQGVSAADRSRRIAAARDLAAGVAGDAVARNVCVGLAESVLNAFSRIPRFRVIARSTAFRWKGSDEEPEAAARRLAADIVITGRITRMQTNLAAHLEAVDVGRGTQIWGEKFRI